MFRKIEKIHFIGVGGIGMSGIAEVLLNLGFKVTGSDLRTTETTERLASLGAGIFYGHKEENVTEVDVVRRQSVAGVGEAQTSLSMRSRR